MYSNVYLSSFSKRIPLVRAEDGESQNFPGPGFTTSLIGHIAGTFGNPDVQHSFIGQDRGYYKRDSLQILIQC